MPAILPFALDLSFVTDGWPGHLSYLLLVLSMLMRQMLWLRLFVIASAIAGMVFDHYWLGNPVGVFWQGLLVLVNVGELALLWRDDHRASFSPEEDQFRTELLHDLSPGHTRRFLDRGRWEDLPDGAVLTTEGKAPDFLTYLARGTVRIETRDRVVRVVEEGHYIGEMSVMGDGIAVATATAQGDVRVWRIERPKLDRIRDRTPAIMSVVEAGIARDMRAKLVFQNETGAETEAG